MSQTAQTAQDIKFRTALVNMRYGACTAADIEFLRGRKISRRASHPTFDEPRFRNVSLITAWNSQKDKINELGCAKFAEETGQVLTHFYAEDTLAANSGSHERRSHANRNKEVVLPQRALTTDQKKSHSSLCIGLPVMIRNNDATELCISRGQESVVTTLDTVLVKLTNPPKTVRIPGLADNVVGLTKGNNKMRAPLQQGVM
ncbi:hypothetical protein B0H10DRAFT_2161576 [Mycena sp. CBHHK59/15]|nr:hypothetical protein B0H10DRAFT_2161576 [Mycena sp. CBHHK59/15]